MWLLFLKIYKNPYIEEEKTTQWPKEKVQKDNQRSTTTHTYKTKDGETRTPLKTGGELGFCEGWAVPDPLVAYVVLI